MCKDGLYRTSERGKHYIGRVFDLIEDRTKYPDKEYRDKVAQFSAELKSEGLKSSAKFMRNVGRHLNTNVRLDAGRSTTSLTERVMSTLNKRINVGVWSRNGVQAIARIRTAIYYNGWRA